METTTVIREYVWRVRLLRKYTERDREHEMGERETGEQERGNSRPNVQTQWVHVSSTDLKTRKEEAIQHKTPQHALPILEQYDNKQ